MFSKAGMIPDLLTGGKVHAATCLQLRISHKGCHVDLIKTGNSPGLEC